jgi:hypothetical protein
LQVCWGQYRRCSCTQCSSACTLHFYHNLLDKLPRTRHKAVAALLRAIPRAKEPREVLGKGLRGRLRAQGVEETLTCALLTPEHMKEDPHEQRHRAAELADQEAHRHRRQLPDWRRCREAGGSEVQVRGRGRLGLQALPRHRPAGRLGRQGGAQETGRLASTTGTVPRLEKVRKTIDGTDAPMLCQAIFRFANLLFMNAEYLSRIS